MVAIIGNTICEAPAGANIARRESYTAIAGVTTAVPSRLMPLSANHFAYLTTNGSIQLATLTNGKWIRKQLLGATASTLQAANRSVADRLEHAIGRTANGYYISGLRTAYLISRPADGSSAPVYTKVTLPSDATLYSASYNNTDYWYYRDRGQFVCRQPSTGSAWQDPSAVYLTESPLTCKDVTFAYSPVAGLIAVNRDPEMLASDTNGKFPTLPAAYRNGKWINLAPNYNTPYLIEEQPSYTSTFNSLLWRLPVEDPRGFCIDPLFPEYAHMGSTWEGLAAMNVLDPKKFPILNVTPGDNLSKLPSRTEIPKSTWGTFTGLDCAGFDADNTLWMAKTNAMSPVQEQQNKYTLFYWTPESRRETLLNNDPALGEKWKTIEVNGGIYGGFWIWGQALAHPSNRNKLVLGVHGSAGKDIGRPAFVFDHKGTLENEADDSVISFTGFIMPSGEITDIGYINDFVEDRATGTVVTCSPNGTYLFDPNSELVNGYMPARILSTTSDFDKEYNFIAPFSSTTACFDEYNRLWIAGWGCGVIGMSPGQKDVIALFSTQNSPLPSNNIFGIGWNPDTKSLFVSTDMGIVEILVDNYLSETPSDNTQAPLLTPSYVNSDYAGTVAIHSLPVSTLLKVTDTKGTIIATLPAAEYGVTYWDLLDKDGNRVPTGKYTVCSATGNLNVKPMTVVVSR